VWPNSRHADILSLPTGHAAGNYPTAHIGQGKRAKVIHPEKIHSIFARPKTITCARLAVLYYKSYALSLANPPAVERETTRE
jgi:hypothetical protein